MDPNKLYLNAGEITSEALKGGFSPILELMEHISASPNLLCRPNHKQLKEIQIRNQIEITFDGRDSHFKMGATFGNILTTFRSWEHIWISCYFFNLIYQKTIEARRADLEEVSLIGETIEIARSWYDLSHERLNREEPLPWPPFDTIKFDLGEIDLVTQLFLTVSGFVLLHETAHIELNHTSSDISQGINHAAGGDVFSSELEADNWAYSRIFSAWRENGENPMNFGIIVISLVIAMGIAGDIEIRNNVHPKSSYPTCIERLDRLAAHCRDDISSQEYGNSFNMARFAVITYVAYEKGFRFPDTKTEFVNDIASFFRGEPPNGNPADALSTDWEV